MRKKSPTTLKSAYKIFLNTFLIQHKMCFFVFFLWQHPFNLLIACLKIVKKKIEDSAINTYMYVERRRKWKRNLGGEKNFLFFISCGICLNEARHVIVSFDMNLWCIHVNKNVTASRVGKLWIHNARTPDSIFSFHSQVFGFTLEGRLIVFKTEDDLKRVKPIAWEKNGVRISRYK